MNTAFLHPLAGVLSAYGMGLAELRAMQEQSLEAPLAEGVLDSVVAELTAWTRTELISQGVHTIADRCRCHVKYTGSDSALDVPIGPVATISETFTAAHRRRFGFVTDQPLIVERVCVEAIEKTVSERPVPPDDEGGSHHRDALPCSSTVSRRIGIPATADPPLISDTDAAGIKAHPDYRAAKAGGAAAAIRLIKDLIRPDTVDEARRRFVPATIFVPVMAEERSGDNAIPVALAQFYHGNGKPE